MKSFFESLLCFFFQAEDGIRDGHVTGVQTCALPIMNLVAKEYVAARRDLGGVLVLSEFTGAADELGQALLINPHDIDGTKATIMRAIAMEPREGRRRMRALRRRVVEHDVQRWADSFLNALSDVRSNG